jgi:UDP-glucuronate 4-epimerase
MRQTGRPSGLGAITAVKVRHRVPSTSVLITGAAGFIGSHLAERCLALGWQVTAVDAFTSYYPEPVKRQNLAEFTDHPGCTLIEGDLLELDLEPILDEVNIVFHLAGQPGVRASWDDFRRYTALNVDATQHLLHAAANASLDRFVLASSSSVYGDAEALPTSETTVLRPVSPYGATKVAAEHLAHLYWRDFGVPAVRLRYFTVYGPRQRPDMAFNRLIACALSGKRFEVLGDGNQTRDFTFVSDAVDGTVAAALDGVPGTAYNIGRGAQHSLNGVLETLGDLLSAPIDVSYHARHLGDARNTAADVSRARYDLGYEPVVDLRAGLSDQLEWQHAAEAQPATLSRDGWRLRVGMVDRPRSAPAAEDPLQLIRRRSSVA